MKAARYSGLRVSTLLGARLRRNQAFALQSFAELGPEDRRAMAGFEEQPHLYGVLVRRVPVPGCSAKLVDHQAVVLLQALGEPGRLPAPAEPEANRVLAAVAGLVLDGVLEIESAGRFATGAAAHSLLFGDGALTLTGRLARLSVDALRYAETLPMLDARALAQRLYSYNQVALHPRWECRFGDGEHLEQALGLGERDRLAARVEADYDAQKRGGWLAWHRAGREPHPERLAHKLYVSPYPDCLSSVFRTTVESFVELAVPAFKIGAGLRGLLRPDKIVAYFESHAALERAAVRLAPRLDGFRAQGVPFSAELTPDGMLSWGVDPPLEEAMVPWRGLESWRLWISNELARALLQAHHDPAPPVEPWRFALDRLRLHGIDTETWAPCGWSTPGVHAETPPC